MSNDNWDEGLDNCIGWASDRLESYLKKNINRLDQSDINQIHRYQNKLNYHVFEIALLGLASSGKTALINALQGKKIGLTSPLHGTTTDLNSVLTNLNSPSELEAIASDPRSETNPETSPESNPPKVQIKLIDTPGLDEVAGKLRAEIATKASQQADLILFVTAGDLTRQELDILSQLKQAFKPVLLIFNKADLYPQSDRHLIHQALQDQELQNLISPHEIIFTSAEPLARRVRLEYVDQTQETWESSMVDVKALKQKILDLLNQDGKSLLAINTMRSLMEINTNVTSRQLDKFPPQPVIASGIFIFKAIAIMISPSSALDFSLSFLIDASLIWGTSKLFDYERLSLGFGLSLVSGMILTTIHNNYGQIAWMGIATPWLIDWLKENLQNAHALKKFIKKLSANSTSDSILQRLKFQF